MKTTTKDAAMPRRAYSYARFSSSSQRDGDSLRRQTDFPEQVCTQEGWCLDDTLKFIDKARSGFHGKNRTPTSALTRFLDLIKRGRIAPGSVLIVENLDRLSRQDVDVAHDLFRDIIKAGVWICTKTPFRIYKGESTTSFMDLLEPIWIMYVAYMESLKKSERCSAAWVTARQQARAKKAPVPGSHPSWLRKTPTGYEIIPEAAEVVRRIHRLSQQGHGYPSIRKILEKEGTPSIGRSRRWSDPFLGKVLRGRQVLGEYHPHEDEHGDRRPVGDPITGYYPAVITEEEWLRTQAAIESRSGKRGRRGRDVCNLFVGLAYEAASKTRLRIRSKQARLKDGSKRKHPYLTVQATGGPSIPYWEAEECILDTLAMLRTADVLDSTNRESERERRISELTARQTALTFRQERLTALAADPDEDLESNRAARKAVGEELAATARELDTLKLQSLTGRAEALGEVQTLSELRKKVQGEEREELDRRIQAALPTVVSEIWMQVQKIAERTQIVHIQIFLRSGLRRYARVLPKNLREERPWAIGDHDLREGMYPGSQTVPA